jgi:hypothetical protein
MLNPRSQVFRISGNALQQAMAVTATSDQSHKICVQLHQAELLTSNPTTSLTKPFFSVSLPISHPLFSSNTVDIMAPFNPRTGGIPLRTFLSDEKVTFVAHAVGDNLLAEEFEIIWQFKMFAQNNSSPLISELARSAILTLNGTEHAPRRIVGGYTGEEHYLGWKKEHFTRFFVEYVRSKMMQPSDSLTCQYAEGWKNVKAPKWLSAAELNGFFPSAVSALDHSLQESIAARQPSSDDFEKVHVQRRFLIGANRPMKPGLSALPVAKSGKSRSDVGKTRASEGCYGRKKGPIPRPVNVYSKKSWYHGNKAANSRKDRMRKTQKRSILAPRNDPPTKSTSPTKPIRSLRDITGLGPVLSKTVKPHHSISACFQDCAARNTEKAPLTQPVRDFIAQKIEEQLLIPDQKETILHIIRTVSPNEFNHRRIGRLIDWRNMSDRLYRQLARFISDTSSYSTKPSSQSNTPTTASFDLSTPASDVLTPEMQHFTRANILKLPLARQQELTLIMERTVPSVDALPHWATETHVLQPEDLPVENQIMMWRYVKAHLPREVGEDEQGQWCGHGREWSGCGCGCGCG